MAEANSTAALKRCTKCLREKPATADFFHAYKRSPDGRRSVCRGCRAKDHADNRGERLLKRREHYQANKDRLLESVRAYYRANAEEQRQAALARHYRNRDLRLQQMKAYRAENRDALLEKQRTRLNAAFRVKYGTDIEFTLRHRTRALIRVTLKNGRKGVRMKDVLGYDVSDLRAHLERQFTRGMNWEKFMAGEIHIDHIVPVAAFNIRAADSPEFRACWALSNLRPMWASENLSKSDKVLTLL